MMKSHRRRAAILLVISGALCATALSAGCDSSRSQREKRRRRSAQKAARQKPRKKERSNYDYVGAVVGAKHFAEDQKCQTRLHTLHRQLRMYEAANGRFPASLAELTASGGAEPGLLECPLPDGQKYLYISGQEQRMDGSNVLVYEQEPDHGGRGHVLRLGGTVEALNSEEIEAAVARTRARLRRR